MFCYQCPPALHPCGPHPPRLPTLDYPFAATHPCEYEYGSAQMYLKCIYQIQIARCSSLSIEFRLKANDNRPTTDYILLLYLVVTLTNYSISGTKWMKNVQRVEGSRWVAGFTHYEWHWDWVWDWVWDWDLSHIELHWVAHVEGLHWVFSGMNYAHNFRSEGKCVHVCVCGYKCQWKWKRKR